MAHWKGVILDVDGTLVDSNDAHARSWVEVFAEAGYHVPFEKVRHLIGEGGDKLLPQTIGVDQDSPEGKALSEKRTRRFLDAYLPKLEPFPKARELLLALRARGLDLVVASSASEDELGQILEAAGVADLLEERTSSDDAERSKPDPDIVTAAARVSGHRSDELVVIGDTPYDVEAATRAGIACIALRSGGWADHALAGAVAIFDDAADLLSHVEETPLGGRFHLSGEEMRP